MDGRVLSEAMVNHDPQAAKAETQTIEATRRLTAGTWKQTLRISQVGSTIYLDEGNGNFQPNERQK